MDERGNALVEFIALGLVGQLILFGFLIRLGVDFRSQLVAESIARQTLRSAQLTGNSDSGLATAKQAAQVFGIAMNEVQVNFLDSCSSQNFLSATVKVRGKQYVARGFCFR